MPKTKRSRSGRGEDQGRAFWPEAAPERPDQHVERDGGRGSDGCERPGGVDVEAAHRADRKHAHAAFGAGELADHRAEDRRGRGDLEPRDKVRNGRESPDMDQLRPAAAAVGVDEVEPAGRGGAEANEKRHEGGVIDRERGEDRLRTDAGTEQHPQDRADGHQRQAEHDESQRRDNAAEARNEDRDGGEKDRGKVAGEKTERGAFERGKERAEEKRRVSRDIRGDVDRTGEQERAVKRPRCRLPEQEKGGHAKGRPQALGGGRGGGDGRRGHSAAARWSGGGEASAVSISATQAAKAGSCGIAAVRGFPSGTSMSATMRPGRFESTMTRSDTSTASEIE
jgi:hypothetical protein